MYYEGPNIKSVTADFSPLLLQHFTFTLTVLLGVFPCGSVQNITTYSVGMWSLLSLPMSCRFPSAI